MPNFKYIVVGYWLLAIGLFLYSYTQVDLNLTLSEWSIWRVIQTSFQQIGWFNRPLSTYIYITLVLLLATCYWLLARLIRRNNITVKQFWKLVIPVSLILLFSYNAFSYDLFNYMFYGRIITYHGENPYIHRALDYVPGDPWTNFMRWTHNTYPYGPVWLVLTVPLSFIGMQFFLPTLFLYKGLMIGSYLGTTYFIGKILEKFKNKEKLWGMAFFALSPLVLSEALVSAHNDMVMIFFSVLALYFLMDKKYIRAFLVLFLSIGIKFATAFLIPIFLLVLAAHVLKKKFVWEHVFLAIAGLMTIAIVFASQRTELQPWYLLWVFPFVALLQARWVKILLTAISIGLLLHYVPYLYTGNWDPPIPTIKFALTVGSVIIGLLTAFVLSPKQARDGV